MEEQGDESVGGGQRAEGRSDVARRRRRQFTAEEKSISVLPREKHETNLGFSDG